MKSRKYIAICIGLLAVLVLGIIIISLCGERKYENKWEPKEDTLQVGKPTESEEEEFDSMFEAEENSKNPGGKEVSTEQTSSARPDSQEVSSEEKEEALNSEHDEVSSEEKEEILDSEYDEVSSEEKEETLDSEYDVESDLETEYGPVR